MDCSKVNDFFMKYMDNILTDEEAQQMNDHLLGCKICRDDFTIYDQMLKSFETEEFKVIEAPADFEQRVMAKIEAMDVFKKYLVWGVLSILLGVGFVLQFDRAMELMRTVTAYVNSFVLELFMVFETLLNQTLLFLTDYQYFFLFIFAVLVMVQYFLYKKEKIEA